MQIRVWGNRALFTRPETLAEPCTYPAITPTAAKGLLESIFWKPEMKYKINFVKVLKPLKFQDVMINGIQDKPTLQAINKGYVASEHRSQRNCLYLLDVEYVIDFDVIALEECIPKTKYVDIATRRIDKGQSFRQPYLGTKECLAYFEWATGEEQPHESFKYITIDMGWLPLKIEHENNLNRDLQQFRIIDGVINYKL